MVNRTRRTVVRAPTSSPTQAHSPGPAESRSASSRPREPPQTENAPQEPLNPSTAMGPNDATVANAPTVTGRTARSGGSHRSGRSMSRQSMRDGRMDQMMGLILAQQRQMREVQLELARMQKRPVEDEGPSERNHTPVPGVFPRADMPPPPPPPVSQPVMMTNTGHAGTANAVPMATPSVPVIFPMAPPQTVPQMTPGAVPAFVAPGVGPSYPVYYQEVGANGITPPSYNMLHGEGSSKKSGEDGPSKWQVEKFLKNGGYMFVGKPNPDDADDWLVTTKGVFQSMACPPEYWVRVASGSFKGKARVWWNNSMKNKFKGKEPKDIGWDVFQKAFDDKYFPPEVRKRKELEFETLRQGNLSITEYEAKFTNLGRFCPDLILTEQKRADRFYEGLNYPHKKSLSTLRYTTVDEVVWAASRDERIYEGRGQPGGQHKKGAPGEKDQNKSKNYQGYDKKNQRDDTFAMRAMQGQPKKEIVCFQCQQPGHTKRNCPGPVVKEDQETNIQCFGCKQWGHIKRNCPFAQQNPAFPQPQQYAMQGPVQPQGRPRGQGRGQNRGYGQTRQPGIMMAAATASDAPPAVKTERVNAATPAEPEQAQARMMAATVAEALADHEVITGTITVGYKTARVLFDSGCTHSFMSYKHAYRLGMKICELGQSLVVTTLAGVVTVVGQCIKQVPV